MIRKTKIVATIGPSSSSKETLTQMIHSGVNVCRINFSHGDYATAEEVIKTIREINTELKTNVAILGDLQGPKIRVGKIDGVMELAEGSTINMTTDKKKENEALYISYQHFAKDVKKGEEVLLDDGKIMLRVEKTNGKDLVQLKVVNGGGLTSNKGVNLPNSKLTLPSLTEKDKEDLDFCLDHDLDWVALSFVRSPRDIIELKHMITNREGMARVIAKIEKPEAVDHLEDIIKESDGIMVARGDLGVEIPMQKVPLLQKKMITLCQRAAKPVIIATQMMESMIGNISPTRAEVNDVANAVLDGADALMLSGETSVGKFPVQVIEAMSKIIEEAEEAPVVYNREFPPESKGGERFITDSICFNSCRLAQRAGAQAIVTMTHSGYTAFKISSFRPEAGIFVFTGNPKILNMLSLVWGVEAYYYDKFVSTDHTIADIKYLLKKQEVVNEGDLIINIASIPIKEKGQSNMLKLSVVD